MLKRYQIKELDGDSVERLWVYDTRCFGIDELNESDVIYTFNPTRGIYHKNSTYALSGEVYSINYQMGNESNLVHETTHAIQADRLSLGIIDRPSDMQDWEVGAYSTQYSFDPQSLSYRFNLQSYKISKQEN